MRRLRSSFLLFSLGFLIAIIAFSVMQAQDAPETPVENQNQPTEDPEVNDPAPQNTEPAPETIRPDPEPAPRPRRETEPRPQAPVQPVQTAPVGNLDGMVDTMPLLENQVLPGYEARAVEDPPHLSDEGNDIESAGTPDEQEPDTDATDSGDDGRSVLDWWDDTISNMNMNTQVVNVVALILLVIVFVVYRLRSGSRRSY